MLNNNALYDEKEEFNKLIKYFILSLKQIKKYAIISESELYERDIGVTKEEIKKCKIKILKYMKYKNIKDIARVYEDFLEEEFCISLYLRECNSIIKQYKKQV